MKKRVNRAIEAFLQAEIERLYNRDKVTEVTLQFNEGGNYSR